MSLKINGPSSATYAPRTGGKSVRRRELFPSRLLTRQVMATPPTFTIVSGNSPINAANTLANTPVTSGLLTLAGADALIPNTIGNTAMFRRSDRAPDGNNRKDGPVRFIFGTDAASIAVNVYWDSGATYRVLVDDQYAMLTPASPGVAGSTRWLRIDFGSAKPRKVVFETNAAVQGVDIPPTASIWPIVAKGPKVVCFGDSYTGGSNGNDSSFTTWPSIMGDHLGWENISQSGVGSTGVLVTTGGFANNAAGQIAAAVAAGVTPEIVVASWGHNDTDTNANIAAGAAAAFSSMRTQWPNALIVFLGHFWVGGTAQQASNQVRENAMAAAVAPYADLSILQATGTGIPFFTGAGKVGATTGTGNSDAYVYSDGVHPTQAGHDYLGYRIAQKLIGALAY